MSRALVGRPEIAGVGFTGSSAAGAAIAREAAGKRLLLELGGNGPSIVLADADVERAAAAIASAAFWNAGQSCAAAGRILVEPSAHDPLAEALAREAGELVLGLPWEEATTLGPVHTRTVAETTLRHIADARSRGADVLTGGAARAGLPTALYLEPTVVAGVPVDAAVQAEETFGPLAALSRVSGDDEIARVADASPLGLSAAIFTRDLARAIRLAERLRVGQVVVNDTSNYWELHMTFGGAAGKRSGLGRIGGRHALEAVTDPQSLAIDVR
jgi:acyl-CoA reductase-like NAD-dependent aldehyde dehydrogenase